MKKIVVSIGIITLLSIMGCQKEEEEEPTGGEGGKPIPLAVGNWWAYRTIEDGDTTYDDTIQVIDTTTYSGKTAYLVAEEEDTFTMFYDGGYLKVVEEWEIVDEEGDTTDTTWVINFLKESLSEGDRWTVLSSQYLDDFDQDGEVDTALFSIEGEVTGQEDVTVPAGTFSDAYKIEWLEISRLWYSNNGDDTTIVDTSNGEKMWVSSGDGLVKESYEYEEVTNLAHLKDSIFKKSLLARSYSYVSELTGYEVK